MGDPASGNETISVEVRGSTLGGGGGRERSGTTEFASQREEPFVEWICEHYKDFGCARRWELNLFVVLEGLEVYCASACPYKQLLTTCWMVKRTKKRKKILVAVTSLARMTLKKEILVSKKVICI